MIIRTLYPSGYRRRPRPTVPVRVSLPTAGLTDADAKALYDDLEDILDCSNEMTTTDLRSCVWFAIASRVA